MPGPHERLVVEQPLHDEATPDNEAAGLVAPDGAAHVSTQELAAMRASDATASTRQIDAIHEQFSEDTLVTKERALITADPELQQQYTSIIEHGDSTALREKSRAQLANLEKMYYGTFSVFTLGDRLRKRNKIKSFGEFVDTLAVVRADKNEHAEYLSPEQTGISASYGPQDVMVHAEQFVYASFTEIGHGMSQGKHQRKLDMQESAPRAQMVMNDIANVVARTPGGETFMKKYLANVFDFDTGKKILATYLASVFDTPQQAIDMIGRAGGQPMVAQQWDQGLGRLDYRDSTFQGNSSEEYHAQDARDAELGARFISRMQEILAQTGIEPPLSIEVRIKDSAKVTA